MDGGTVSITRQYAEQLPRGIYRVMWGHGAVDHEGKDLCGSRSLIVLDRGSIGTWYLPLLLSPQIFRPRDDWDKIHRIEFIADASTQPHYPLPRVGSRAVDGGSPTDVINKAIAMPMCITTEDGRCLAVMEWHPHVLLDSTVTVDAKLQIEM